MKISLWCLSYNITVYIYICKYSIIYTVYIYYIILYNIVYTHVHTHIRFLCSKANPVNSRCIWPYSQPPLLTVLHHSGFNSHLQLQGQAQIHLDRSHSLSSQSHFCSEKMVHNLTQETFSYLLHSNLEGGSPRGTTLGILNLLRIK